jgi:putative ubiquitin-RnfH superfamily antitoxin RatB of RatAB toxin-antitoxin module
MRVGVVYSEPGGQFWVEIEVPEGATAAEAIGRSGVLQRFSHIDLGTQKIGVFGKIVKPDMALKPGDRVEIYRPITADPQTVPRRDGVGGGGED